MSVRLSATGPEGTRAAEAVPPAVEVVPPAPETDRPGRARTLDELVRTHFPA